MIEDAARTAHPPAPTPAIEVDFPDLAAHASGNADTPYVWTFGSNEAGPHVVIQALTHGNEVCGAIAVDWMLREKIRPLRGTLTLVFANVAPHFHPSHVLSLDKRVIATSRHWTKRLP